MLAQSRGQYPWVGDGGISLGSERSSGGECGVAFGIAPTPFFLPPPACRLPLFLCRALVLFIFFVVAFDAAGAVPLPTMLCWPLSARRLFGDALGRVLRSQVLMDPIHMHMGLGSAMALLPAAWS